jgi:hypothetical protein
MPQPLAAEQKLFASVPVVPGGGGGGARLGDHRPSQMLLQHMF